MVRLDLDRGFVSAGAAVLRWWVVPELAAGVYREG
jgi:hypothetical protein